MALHRRRCPPRPVATVAVFVCMFLFTPGPAAAQFANQWFATSGAKDAGPSLGSGQQGFFTLESANKWFQQITDPLVFGGGLSGRRPRAASSIPSANPFGWQQTRDGPNLFANRGGRGGGADFNPKDLEKMTDPLTGDQFQAFLDAVAADLDSAAITSAALNLASGIVYTVSGALATASVGLSIVTAVPVFFFGLFNLEVSAIAFLQGLQADYGSGQLSEQLITELGKINAAKEKIKSGEFIKDMTEALTQLREVRTMLKDIRTSSPLGQQWRKVMGR
ncbi:hypothetical protein HYH03_016962 [Edaphochlamys debaryana]|uniref:Uncharacterized protein n=1 Tax=Edaphochlamys debaryana TaxID=47281 RepID=A0A836BPR8_9CHLO|nr:hypothetical protein HYH03_016962 [Edaphochlamys debaryana]|eukprot:KAG2484227.1 hypothetical protein HYH03_016962 [Edaphochlamys debaryana]